MAIVQIHFSNGLKLPSITSETVRLLEGEEFRVLRPRQFSPCDESISVGQIAYGLAWLKKKKSKTRA